MRAKSKSAMRRCRAKLGKYLFSLDCARKFLRAFWRSFPANWVEDRPRSERRTVAFVLWLMRKIKMLRARLRRLLAHWRLWSNRADQALMWR